MLYAALCRNNGDWLTSRDSFKFRTTLLSKIEKHTLAIDREIILTDSLLFDFWNALYLPGSVPFYTTSVTYFKSLVDPERWI